MTEWAEPVVNLNLVVYYKQTIFFKGNRAEAEDAKNRNSMHMHATMMKITIIIKGKRVE